MQRRASLTARMKQTLNYIVDYEASHGYVPSYREIADEFDMALSSVPRILACLEERGYIQRGLAKKPRSMAILQDYTCPHCGERL